MYLPQLVTFAAAAEKQLYPLLYTREGVWLCSNKTYLSKPSVSWILPVGPSLRTPTVDEWRKRLRNMEEN